MGAATCAVLRWQKCLDVANKGKSVIIFFLAAVKQIREQKVPTFTINFSVPIIQEIRNEKRWQTQ